MVEAIAADEKANEKPASNVVAEAIAADEKADEKPASNVVAEAIAADEKADEKPASNVVAEAIATDEKAANEPKTSTLINLVGLMTTCVQHVTASEAALENATPPLLEILAYFTADSEEKRPPLTDFVQNALTIAQNNPALLKAISEDDTLRAQLIDVALTPCAKVLEDVGYEDTAASQTRANLKALLQTCVQHVTSSVDNLVQAQEPLFNILRYFTEQDTIAQSGQNPLIYFVQNALTIAQNNPALLNAISTNAELRTQLIDVTLTPCAGSLKDAGYEDTTLLKALMGNCVQHVTSSVDNLVQAQKPLCNILRYFTEQDTIAQSGQNPLIYFVQNTLTIAQNNPALLNAISTNAELRTQLIDVALIPCAGSLKDAGYKDTTPLKALMDTCVQHVTSSVDNLVQAQKSRYVTFYATFTEQDTIAQSGQNPLIYFVQNALTIAQNNPALLNAISTNAELRTQLIDVTLTPCAEALKDAGYEDTTPLKALMGNCVQHVTSSVDNLVKAQKPLCNILRYFTEQDTIAQSGQNPLIYFVQNALTIAKNNPELRAAISSKENATLRAQLLEVSLTPCLEQLAEQRYAPGSEVYADLNTLLQICVEHITASENSLTTATPHLLEILAYFTADPNAAQKPVFYSFMVNTLSIVEKNDDIRQAIQDSQNPFFGLVKGQIHHFGYAHYVDWIGESVTRRILTNKFCLSCCIQILKGLEKKSFMGALMSVGYSLLLGLCAMWFMRTTYALLFTMTMSALIAATLITYTPFAPITIAAGTCIIAIVSFCCYMQRENTWDFLKQHALLLVGISLIAAPLMTHVIAATFITKAVTIGLSCLTFIASAACVGGFLTNNNNPGNDDKGGSPLRIRQDKPVPSAQFSTESEPNKAHVIQTEPTPSLIDLIMVKAYK